MASPSVIDAFESAKKNFFSHLPKNTNYDFTSLPTIDHVYQAAEKLQKQQERSRSMRYLGKIEPFLESLRHYGNIVDTFVQVKPDVLALIWGPIKFLLQVSSTFHATYDKVLEAMELIGDALPAFQKYTQLFPNNPKMHQALCLFYKDILDFYAILLNFFKHEKWNALFKSLWPHCLGKLQVVTRNILNHKTLLSNEATLASMMQAQIDRENSLKTYENQYEFQMRQDFEAAMSSLNPRLYDKDLDRCKRQMNPESGNWLNNNQSFKAWLDQTDKSTQVLWLQGIPGAGKTFLSSSVAQRLSAENKKVAAVFPNYRFPQEASALKILHSLITQLILDESNLRHLLISAHYEDYRQLNSSVDFARNLLRQVLDCLSEIYVVIDGLDEMQETERVLLLKAMLALSQDNRDVKILVSSRPEDDITRLLGQKTSSIQVHDANSSDIASYVDNRALYWINELSPGPSQAKDIRNLMRRIALNAQGMFLYARLLCDVVVLKSSIDGMEEAIDDLPNGLDEAYDRILARIESFDEHERNEAKQILSMTASCEVPLTKTEIQLGVYISLGGDPSQGCERILLNVCRRCGPIIEEVEGYIQFVHFTAHEYLLASLGNRSQYLNEAETHGDISLMSLNYLNSSCFDTDLSEAEFHGYIIRGTFVLENYVATYWISHLKKSEYAHSRARIQLAAETLIMSRQNPLFAAFAPSDNDISDFQFIGDFCYDVATAFGFCKMRKRDLCFSDEEQLQSLDPFTFSTTQSRLRSTLEGMLCSGQHHRAECFCTTLKTLYGDAIWKCGRPGCSFFRIGFTTKARRDRHMQAHSRPFKCDQEGCSFAQLGFSTQSHLRVHHQQYHGQKKIKSRSRKYKKTKKQELKLILIDAVKEDDLQTIRDIWDLAQSFRTVLLVTAVQERASQATLDFLVEHVNFEQIPESRRVRDIFNLLEAAVQTTNVGIFAAYGIQQLLCSYEGEKKMIKIIHQVAATRNAGLVAEVARHIPPMLFSGFLEILIPYRPSEEAEAEAVECLKRIRHMARYRQHLGSYLSALGARCCSIPIAQFLIEDGADVNSNGGGHSALFAASKSTDGHAAEFMKFLLDHGADVEEVYLKQPLSSRPAAKTIHRWLGMTWEEVVTRYKKQDPTAMGQDATLRQAGDVLNGFDFDSFLTEFDNENPSWDFSETFANME